ncbi:InlB B-repeat-containing protein [Oscillospiraceae bacterium LTW-04]|nr:InlB B-repeat-containing protein [Oscillospiraceae bacterium MB24-C1]
MSFKRLLSMALTITVILQMTILPASALDLSDAQSMVEAEAASAKLEESQSAESDRTAGMDNTDVASACNCPPLDSGEMVQHLENCPENIANANTEENAVDNTAPVQSEEQVESEPLPSSENEAFSDNSTVVPACNCPLLDSGEMVQHLENCPENTSGEAKDPAEPEAPSLPENKDINNVTPECDCPPLDSGEMVQHLEDCPLYKAAGTSLLGKDPAQLSLLEQVKQYEAMQSRYTFRSFSMRSAPIGQIGSPSNPFVIGESRHLLDLAYYVENGSTYLDKKYADACYVMVNDISMGTDRVIIGTLTSPFSGTFDGAGFDIKNLKYQRERGSNVGLFGSIGQEGVVKNLGVVDAFIDTGSQHQDPWRATIDENIGILAGYSEGTITNCYTSGVIQGTYIANIGGIAGLSSGTISDCYSTFEINREIMSDSTNIGGIAGISTGTISRCYYNGYLIGAYFVGGIVGRTEGIVSECYTAGVIETPRGSAGGIASAILESGSISDCYNTSDIVTSNGFALGGIAGWSSGSIKNCYNLGNVTTYFTYGGGIIGYANETASITNSVALCEKVINGKYVGADRYKSGGVSGIPSTGLSNCYAWSNMSVEVLQGQSINCNATGVLSEQFSNIFSNDSNSWVFVDNALPILKNTGGTQSSTLPHWIKSYTFQGNGTSTSPYLIKTAQDFIAIGSKDSTGKFYKLNNNIDFNGISPLINFKGTFDGNNRVIQNTTGALFSKVERGAVIKNLGVVDCNIVGDTVGAIANITEGSIINCYSTGRVNGETAGGIAGLAMYEKVKIENCYSTCAIEGTKYAGGILGQSTSTINITRCYSRGDIAGYAEPESAFSTGGIAGWIESGAIMQCYVTGDLSGDNIVGGVIGGCNSGTISASVYLGRTIRVNIYDPDIKTGMIIGDDTNGTVIDSYYWSNAWNGNNEETKGNKLDAAILACESFWADIGLPRPDPFPAWIASIGTGTQSDPFLIQSIDDLIRLRDEVNDNRDDKSGKFYKLINDIDMGEKSVSAIGTSSTPFQGNFDGNGHVIRNLNIYRGLFNYVGENAVISGLGLENCIIKGSTSSFYYNTGGIAVYSKGTIKECYVTGHVSGYENVGAIVAENAGIVSDCYSSATVLGYKVYNWRKPNVGNIVGNNTGTISNCYSTGYVNSSGLAGGIAGYSSGTAAINNCVALNSKISSNTNENAGHIAASGGFNNGYSLSSINTVNEAPNSRGLELFYSTSQGLLTDKFEAFNWTESGFSLDKWDIPTDNKKLPKLKNSSVQYPNIHLTKQKTIVASFDAQGGSAVEPQDLAVGDAVAKPTGPIRNPGVLGAADEFVGWFTESECLNEWVFSTPITENITLYAKWKIALAGNIIEDIEPQVVTGEPIKPTPKVEFKIGEETITLNPCSINHTHGENCNNDFYYSYENNVNLGDTATVIVNAVRNGNYIGSVSKSFVISKESPIISNVPQAKSIIFGQTLSTAQLTGGSAVNSQGGEVTGTWQWKTNTTTPVVGTSSHAVVFTPNKTEKYSTATVDVPVSVYKSTPILTVPTVSAITYGQKLSDSTLSGGSAYNPYNDTFTVDGTWEWVDNTSAPTASSRHNIIFTPVDDQNYNAVTTTVWIEVEKLIPNVTAPAASDISYGQKLSESLFTGGSAVDPQNNKLTVEGEWHWLWPNTFPSALNDFTAVFEPTNSEKYSSVNVEVWVIVNKATLSITAPTASDISYGQSLSASALTGGSAVNAHNNAVIVRGTWAWKDTATVPKAGSPSHEIIFTPNDIEKYVPATVTIPVTVYKVTPSITAPTAVDISYGQKLSGSVFTGGSAVNPLNNELMVTGSWTWETDATMTELGTSSHRVIFTPDEAENYNTSTGNVSITVNKATPTLTAPKASDIRYGQKLSDSLLTSGLASNPYNSAWTIPGTWRWTDDSIAPQEGSSIHTVVFTPNDAENYNTTTTTVAVAVDRVTPSITVPSASEITYGQKLSDSLLTGGMASNPHNSALTVSGTWAWKDTVTAPKAGTSSHEVIFTPDDAGKYSVATATISVSVKKAVPILTAPAATDICFGQTLSGSTLTGGLATNPHDSSLTVSGRWLWEDDTTAYQAGEAIIHPVVFTPDDAENYNPATTDASITVKKAVPNITVPIAADIRYGQRLSDSTLTGGSAVNPHNSNLAVTGTWEWDDDTTMPEVGTSSHMVIFTPHDTNNYNTATGRVSVTVNKAPSSILEGYEVPKNLYAITNTQKTLEDVNLPKSDIGYWSWQTPKTALVADDENRTQTFLATFNPTDSTNYEKSVDIPVPVKLTEVLVTFDSYNAVTIAEEGATAEISPTISFKGEPLLSMDGIEITDLVTIHNSCPQIVGSEINGLTLIITGKQKGISMIEFSVNGKPVSHVLVKYDPKNYAGHSNNSDDDIESIEKMLNDIFSGGDNMSDTQKEMVTNIAQELIALTKDQKQKLDPDTIKNLDQLYGLIANISTSTTLTAPSDLANEISSPSTNGLALASGEKDAADVEVKLTQQTPTNYVKETQNVLEIKAELFVNGIKKQLHSPLIITFTLPSGTQADDLVINHYKSDGTLVETITRGTTLAHGKYTLENNVISMYVSEFSTFTFMVPVEKILRSSSSDNGPNEEQKKFWDVVETAIKAARNGDTVKVSAKWFDQMPDSVMSELRRSPDVTLVIDWNGGKTITVPAGMYQDEDASRIYWPLSLLETLYGDAPTKTIITNPTTGGVIKVTAPKEAELKKPITPESNGVDASNSTQKQPHPEKTVTINNSENSSSANSTSIELVMAFVLSIVAIGTYSWKFRKKKKL